MTKTSLEDLYYMTSGLRIRCINQDNLDLYKDEQIN